MANHTYSISTIAFPYDAIKSALFFSLAIKQILMLQRHGSELHLLKLCQIHSSPVATKRKKNKRKME